MDLLRTCDTDLACGCCDAEETALTEGNLCCNTAGPWVGVRVCSAAHTCCNVRPNRADLAQPLRLGTWLVSIDAVMYSSCPYVVNFHAATLKRVTEVTGTER